ncbi:unnamed protein product [Arabidopsis lyrata]|uniref:putative inactive histone-lysine N-methyltransferase family member SUVH10 n=1 Tax=Arabidopsis lyrata subsp. lyrata TaxID=81972 RepID=UPI000A29D843|nr:putative inactive histone-lysine N-methyltransferase family member SUVH10 [Arabidopsis lyrata subsp. lyrata]CAH8262018.1 unnamed protein product [Arabidopsis lyrata]|eukprot:XP_020888606.1 putative inactive histone-lysine N-methyltransferase family member SUVH10 [Arabidopsis lyrata subsp. lyrata]
MSDRLIELYPFFQGGMNEKDQETGNSELVSSVMMRFDAVRRRLSQIGDMHREVVTALRTFKTLKLYTNTKKRVGSVPGVDVGDIFFIRGEMALVGLHAATVDMEFIGVEDSGDREDKQIAVSIISSGKNADKTEDPDSLIFTGFGGTDKYHDQPSDQKLERLNIPLEAAFRKKSIVRVIRGMKDEKRTHGNVYIYDGTYMITNMWQEEGQNGFIVFKFQLVREPDQKPAFGIWKSVKNWKNDLSTRPGLILQDLSNGAENLKVCVVNEVDKENGPSLFTYVTSLHHEVINIRPMVDPCACGRRSCGPKSGSCACVQRNEGGIPYVDGVLVTRGPTVFECGGSCPCYVKCKNKMIQTGLKFHLEVFKTMDSGWGLRSWDPIRAGSFICEYAGEIIAKGDDEEDDYIFDTSRVYNSFKWNYEPEIVGEDTMNKVFENISVSSSLVISAKKAGNVARFMNHSCSPNVFWQPISREENGLWCLYIGFFAMKHIPPLTELRYDYGKSRGGGKKMCLCRSKKCCGSFG